MVFCILSDPAIAIVDIAGMYILISNLRKNYKPLAKELCSEPIVRACMSKINHQFKWLITEWLQSKNDVVNQQVAIGFSDSIMNGRG